MIDDTTHIIIYDTLKRTVIDTIHFVDTTKYVEKTVSGIDTNLWIAITTGIIIISSLIINWLLNRRGYKDEYYKQIIEKRLSAYSDAEQIVATLGTHKFENGKPVMHKIFEDWDSYEQFYKLLLDIGTRSYWLNNETDKKLVEIEQLLRNHILPLIEPEPDELAPDIQKIGKELYSQLELIVIQLQYLIFKDFKKLHIIPKFIKSKAPSSIILSMTKEEYRKYIDSQNAS